MKPSTPLSAIAAAGILLLHAGPSAAQESRLPTTDWRQANRTDAVAKKVTSPESFGFELRFGGYTPQIDQEPGLGGKTPYKSILRPDDDAPQFYFGMELDYLPLRIPYVGRIGPRVGWGYTHTSQKANFTDSNPPEASDVDTGLTIMPMYAGLVLRIDELMRRTDIPIVPYGKAGFGMAYWNASTSTGTETYVNAAGNKVSANGLSWGFEFAVGGMLALNFLDPRAAARLDEATGVNHAYVFGEWMNNSMVGRNSKNMYVGTSTWVLGLAVDM
ncbi:MAG: MXAN_2562 family outer membrane beta-barrel protein [Byssovorax sp.]